MWLQDFVYNTINKIIPSRVYTAFSALIHGDLEYRIYKLNEFALSVAKLHDATFTPYKNKFAGKEIAVIACGPSANAYKPIQGVINIGVNKAFTLSNIKLDFFFIQDAGIFNIADRHLVNAYGNDQCIKFYGISNERLRNDFADTLISESDAIKAGAKRYYTDHIEFLYSRGYEPSFPLDISTQPLGHFGSVVFSAIQFALWTNPKRIYLIGCDCTSTGHFYNNSEKTYLALKLMLYGYKKLKAFANAFYPDTEIVSVNPVGLKGLFRDLYQNDLSTT